MLPKGSENETVRDNKQNTEAADGDHATVGNADYLYKIGTCICKFCTRRRSKNGV